MRLARTLPILVPILLLALLTVAGCQSGTAPQPAQTQPSAAAPVPTQKNTQSQGGSMSKQYSSPPAMTIDANKSYTATLHTTLGDIQIQFFPKDALKTVNNFVFLAKDGYYSNVPFHRIIKGFMVQTGDPTGTGAGGPGYKFNDEPVTRNYDRGIVAMANAGPNTNGSQFFIIHANYQLQKNYTIFGQVTDQPSLDVLDKIATVPVTASRTGEQSVPSQQVLINSVDITEK
jgi:cyclophilin family peptidyl-prolyl cis-trans isomerase